MKEMNKGRKPIETKQKSVSFAHDELFGNALKVDEALENELTAKGLIGRWVDYKKLVEFAGYHKNGWVPYKREKSDTIGSSNFINGMDPDGLVRRGTVVLAVKPKETVESHRSYLRMRAETYGAQVNKKKAEELRALLKSNNLNSEVIEGYEDNE